MNDDLNAHLLAADPLTREPELSPDDREAMRRTVIAALDTPPRHRARWPIAILAAAAGLAAVAVLLLMPSVSRMQRDKPVPTAPADAAITEAPRAERREVQFQTPGGTRIIWVLNPDVHF